MPKKLSKTQIKKRIAFRTNSEKPLTSKEIQKKSVKNYNNLIKDVSKIKDPKIRKKLNEILSNSEHLIKNINVENKEKVFEIIKKIKNEVSKHL